MSGELPEELRNQIDEDMARVAHMEFREMVGFLASYTATVAVLMRQHNVTHHRMWAYADAALERAEKGRDEEERKR